MPALKDLSEALTNCETDSIWNQINSDQALYEKLMEHAGNACLCAALEGAPCTEEGARQLLAQRLPDLITARSRSNKVQWGVIAEALVNLSQRRQGRTRPAD